MADDKSLRGSPDNKRLNRGEDYEVRYAKEKARKAAAKKAAPSKRAAAKSTAKTPATKRATARKAPAKKAASKRAPAKRTSSARPSMPGGMSDVRPRPTRRADRSAGQEKNPANTAPAAKRTPDAIDLLVDDHLAVDACFKRYEKLMKADASGSAREAQAREICRMLTAHTTIEEEIFYPAARRAGLESDLLDEADVEHASAKSLIAQIEGGSPSDPLYDARVTVLGEYIKHHVVEEHGEMFPKCRRAGMDLVALREQMEARKAELGG
jgi:hypothetical protein